MLYGALRFVIQSQRYASTANAGSKKGVRLRGESNQSLGYERRVFDRTRNRFGRRRVHFAIRTANRVAIRLLDTRRVFRYLRHCLEVVSSSTDS
jgi:hypothetical protein